MVYLVLQVSHTFLLPLHLTSSVFNSISSGESFCFQIPSSSFHHLSLILIICKSNSTSGIHIRQFSWNSSLHLTQCGMPSRHSFKFVIWLFKFVTLLYNHIRVCVWVKQFFLNNTLNRNRIRHCSDQWRLHYARHILHMFVYGQFSLCNAHQYVFEIDRYQ